MEIFTRVLRTPRSASGITEILRLRINSAIAAVLLCCFSRRGGGKIFMLRAHSRESEVMLMAG